MKHHPSIELLTAYANGTIDACNGITIASHLETCPQCQAEVEKLEAKQASQEFEHFPQAQQDMSFDMEQMFNDITNLQPASLVPRIDGDIKVTVNGKEFVLPRALHSLTHRLNDWKSYGGKVYSANFDIDENERVSLLYISGGVQVPQHTHKGIETTLVLHGRFVDEEGEYQEGDFTIADSTTRHSPRTEVGQDCLCLTVLSEPMVFTQGPARIFNLFGRGMYP
ncbi:ChrR family anti-sigma-E factor [Vibrio gallicus]|uniref:ChrR family anti-sigma-E factor n=1 Tax=Vibrio gallicus TaxID=190897 RepID=UPI0021C2682C|nr:ChrR family anti-sigma-E factor [Vibrio gallicus]